MLVELSCVLLEDDDEDDVREVHDDAITLEVGKLNDVVRESVDEEVTVESSLDPPKSRLKKDFQDDPDDEVPSVEVELLLAADATAEKIPCKRPKNPLALVDVCVAIPVLVWTVACVIDV